MKIWEMEATLLHLKAGDATLPDWQVQDALEIALETLKSIHEVLDGEEWDGGTASDVADELMAIGFDIREPGEDDEAEETYEADEDEEATE